MASIVDSEWMMVCWRMAQVWYLPLDGEEPLASLDECSLEGIRGSGQLEGLRRGR